MAENTAIEWCDHTFNPWIGCTKVSPGCDHCYAEAKMDTRLHRVHWGTGQPRVRTKTWRDPQRWNYAHAEFFAAHGRRQRVFCASLADVFDNEVDPQWRADLFKLIAATPNLDWLLLTKRIGNAADMMFLARGGHLPLLPNVWIGATVVNQSEADRDVPKLLATPARVRFLSIEPMLSSIVLKEVQAHGGERVWIDALGGTASALAGSMPPYGVPRLNWVIVGGESGRGARPMHPDWARSLRDQCAAAGVPFLFKQWGEWLPAERAGEDTVFVTTPFRHPGPRRPEFFEFEDGVLMARVTKRAAGRLLDGIEHNGSPEARP